MPTPEPLRLGQRVRVVATGQLAQVFHVNRTRTRVCLKLDGVRVWFDAEELERAPL